ncbi:MAG: glycine zipper 2TM domain-containing protein [Gammaproteobacteria bacterium]|nr:MAG: glycine zipper 2TM domain-containing protein [Gammaproteobacteria bacterium]
MNKTLAIALIAGTVALTGCNKEQMGTLGGAAVGGLAGSQIGEGKGKLAATAVGVLAGALIGGSIGKSMDEVDRMKANQALETAPTGKTVSWTNPDSGSQYAVTPTKTYETSSGPCREYTTEAIIGGKRETIYGTACRQPDGTWQTVN